METRSHKRSSYITDYRYSPYHKITSRRNSFTNSQFRIWKERIDKYVYENIGQHLEDLPDLSYREIFNDGYLKPKQVSHIVLGAYYQIYNLNLLYFNN